VELLFDRANRVYRLNEPGSASAFDPQPEQQPVLGKRSGAQRPDIVIENSNEVSHLQANPSIALDDDEQESLNVE